MATNCEHNHPMQPYQPIDYYNLCLNNTYLAQCASRRLQSNLFACNPSPNHTVSMVKMHLVFDLAILCTFPTGK